MTGALDERVEGNKRTDATTRNPDDVLVVCAERSVVSAVRPHTPEPRWHQGATALGKAQRRPTRGRRPVSVLCSVESAPRTSSDDAPRFVERSSAVALSTDVEQLLVPHTGAGGIACRE